MPVSHVLSAPAQLGRARELVTQVRARQPLVSVHRTEALLVDEECVGAPRDRQVKRVHPQSALVYSVRQPVLRSIHCVDSDVLSEHSDARWTVTFCLIALVAADDDDNDCCDQ